MQYWGVLLVFSAFFIALSIPIYAFETCSVNVKSKYNLQPLEGMQAAIHEEKLLGANPYCTIINTDMSGDASISVPWSVSGDCDSDKCTKYEAVAYYHGEYETKSFSSAGKLYFKVPAGNIDVEVRLVDNAGNIVTSGITSVYLGYGDGTVKNTLDAQPPTQGILNTVVYIPQPMGTPVGIHPNPQFHCQAGIGDGCFRDIYTMAELDDGSFTNWEKLSRVNWQTINAKLYKEIEVAQGGTVSCTGGTGEIEIDLKSIRGNNIASEGYSFRMVCKYKSGFFGQTQTEELSPVSGTSRFTGLKTNSDFEYSYEVMYGATSKQRNSDLSTVIGKGNAGSFPTGQDKMSHEYIVKPDCKMYCIEKDQGTIEGLVAYIIDPLSELGLIDKILGSIINAITFGLTPGPQPINIITDILGNIAHIVDAVTFGNFGSKNCKPLEDLTEAQTVDYLTTIRDTVLKDDAALTYCSIEIDVKEESYDKENNEGKYKIEMNSEPRTDDLMRAIFYCHLLGCFDSGDSESGRKNDVVPGKCTPPTCECPPDSPNECAIRCCT
ncbi:MAG: hypothetical protein ISS36_00175 [Candidatus Aenigmarchaeota archaeon]|nr:hypothetical protein [Candidatus Aenigmarchaeota archaeon]